jgi:hypothetical protein
MTFKENLVQNLFKNFTDVEKYIEDLNFKFKVNDHVFFSAKGFSVFDAFISLCSVIP